VYRWVDHTSELELEIDAVSDTAVIGDAVAALGELLDDEGAEGAAEVIALGVSASDRPTLLAECLGELVFRAETQGFIPKRLVSLELEHAQLEATVEGRRGRPPQLVKAVTYHRLSFERSGPSWRATVVLDV
jgi:SHS2 domain-containing protein